MEMHSYMFVECIWACAVQRRSAARMSKSISETCSEAGVGVRQRVHGTGCMGRAH